MSCCAGASNGGDTRNSEVFWRLAPAAQVDAIVEFVDIFPTLVTLAGLRTLPPCPATNEAASKTKLCSEGRSLATKQQEAKRPENAQQRQYEDEDEERAAFSLWVGKAAAGFTIRRGAYRYTGERHIDHALTCSYLINPQSG